MRPCMHIAPAHKPASTGGGCLLESSLLLLPPTAVAVVLLSLRVDLLVALRVVGAPLAAVLSIHAGALVAALAHDPWVGKANNGGMGG